VIQVVTLEALCDLWFLKTCPIIHLAAYLPTEGDLLLRRENLIADDNQSVDRPKPGHGSAKRVSLMGWLKAAPITSARSTATQAG
jgi:hypothetical protein